MKKLNSILHEVNSVAKIPFKMKGEKGDIYTSPNFYIKTTYVKEELNLFKENFELILRQEDKNAMPLLKSFIISSIKNEAIKKNDLIRNIIEDNNFPKRYVEEVYPFLMNKFTIIIISSNNNNTDTIRCLLEDGYKEENIIIVNYKEKTLILGDLEDPDEHVLSIKETLEYGLGEKILISYCRVNSYNKLKIAINNCLRKIELAEKFNIKQDILGKTSLVFEDIIDSIDEERKKILINEFNKGFDKLDSEMIKTIDVFFKCGLNISESAKALYIHRNTLIYRIEKIQRYTGFDIKEFNNAIVFKILFIIWKEKNFK